MNSFVIKLIWTGVKNYDTIKHKLMFETHIIDMTLFTKKTYTFYTKMSFKNSNESLNLNSKHYELK